VKREILDYIEDIISAMDKAVDFVKNMSYEEFTRDDKTVYAVVRAIEIIGEEAKRSGFVIIGGHQGFNYEEMKLATLAIRNGAHFFVTNRDPVFPTPEGLVPATGAILASIEYATQEKKQP